MAMSYRYKLTVRDEDGDYCTYESDHADELIEQLASLKRDEPEATPSPYAREDYGERYGRMYERRRAAVYATGNKWAIENWEATH